MRSIWQISCQTLVLYFCFVLSHGHHVGKIAYGRSSPRSLCRPGYTFSQFAILCLGRTSIQNHILMILYSQQPLSTVC
uniref:Putative ovule protein n=1 Tax=Solanum chacoense TaxID=4108 RepID=A0A0V0GJH5_SOLCH